MATSKDNTGVNTNFFLSRKNLVGIICAVLVIIVHVIFGLGFLWPVVAVAAWGAGAALTPWPEQKQLPAAPSQPMELVLEDKLQHSMENLQRLKPHREVWQAAKDVELNCIFVLNEWHEIATAPEKQQTMFNIIDVYLPEVVSLYANQPDRSLQSAVEGTVDSLRTLSGAVGFIKQAIIDNNVRMLDDNARALRQKFGNLPGLSTSTEDFTQ